MTDAAAPVVGARDGTIDRGRRIALVVLCAGMFMIILDATIVNVALPTIQSDLRFSQSSLAWVVNAYLIAFGGRVGVDADYMSGILPVMLLLGVGAGLSFSSLMTLAMSRVAPKAALEPCGP